MKNELLKGLSEEQIAKIKACKNQEELLKVAKEEGVELSEEALLAHNVDHLMSILFITKTLSANGIAINVIVVAMAGV